MKVVFYIFELWPQLFEALGVVVVPISGQNGWIEFSTNQDAEGWIKAAYENGNIGMYQIQKVYKPLDS